MTNTNLVIVADGACSGNPGPGGWAFILRDETQPQAPVVASGANGLPHTTNNVMELTGAIEAVKAALNHLEAGCEATHVVFRLDSEYVLKGIFEWRHNWKAKGWKNAQKKVVSNVELWKTLDNLVEELAVHVTMVSQWVKGHNGDPDNELVDDMAVKARDEQAHNGNTKSEPVMLGDILTQVLSEPHAETIKEARRILDAYTAGDLSVKDVYKAFKALK